MACFSTKALARVALEDSSEKRELHETGRFF